MPVHPAVASKFHLLDGIPSRLVALGNPEMMARIDQFFAPSAGFEQPVVDVRDDSAPGPHGPVPVRIYTPDGSAAGRPCLVWMHGGGFMGGDLDMPEADLTAREVCVRAGAVVVSVDYRLAVNAVTYPVPHDDVVAAIRWVRDNPALLGIDPARISVGGGSAGGNLGTGAVLRLRDDDGWLPAALIPVYAVFHAVHPPVPRQLAAALAELPPMLRPSPDGARPITRNFLGGPESRADGYAMPALAALEGLCPTVIINAEYDELRASAQAFSAALALAGVDVRQVMIPGMLHAFLNLSADVEPVDQCLDLMADVVAHQHHEYAASSKSSSRSHAVAT